MAQDLQALLEELTTYPATEQPFLSLYLDLRPDGNGRRTEMLQTLEQSLDMIRDQIKARDGNLQSFDADRERIMDYVNTEAPVDAQAVAIFACDAEGLWYTTPLQAPVETHIFEGRYPHVFDLARVIDDYETYAVVLADSQESRIFVVTLNSAEKVGETESDEEIKRFQAGGWGQMLFQRRTENVIKAHTREIADKLGRLMKRYDVQHVIIAGNDSIKGAVLGSLPKQIQEKLVDYINMDITANMQQIMETIEPLMREVEHEQEADDVDTLEAQVNTKGGLGVIGVEDTAMALSKGQVRLLIMLQDFHATGSLNPQTQFVYGRMYSKDPFDGSDLETVNLREAFPARAAQTGATVQIVEANEYLAAHEGVGALLWYRDDVQQPQQQEEQADLQRGG
jgi:peptide chain release factor subunit 1